MGKTLDAEVAEAFAETSVYPKVVGTADQWCTSCRAMLIEAPVVECPCGCGTPMDRICVTCGGTLRLVARQ